MYNNHFQREILACACADSKLNRHLLENGLLLYSKGHPWSSRMESTSTEQVQVDGVEKDATNVQIEEPELTPTVEIETENNEGSSTEGAQTNSGNHLSEVELKSKDEKVGVEDEMPDIEKLTIKNLDTGEQFIIGENDPDFDFDTFELRRGVEATPIIATKQQQQEMVDAVDGTANVQDDYPRPPAKSERKSFWLHFLNVIYGSKHSKKKEEQAKLGNDFSVVSKPKTPFTKLSNFKFRKELGRGAFGRVLLAESKADGKLFALKIITKKNMRTSDKRQAKAERDILHAMTLKAPHPFTSGLKFAFQSENNLYLGMDYIPGGNLRELIKKFKFLPEDWVRFYAAELVLAISHLHSLNVLYRDIKPHNVMIDARGHLILIDFGLSKQEIIHPRGALSLVGTPDYSAPEVLKTGVQQIEAHNRERNNANAGGPGGKKSPTKAGGSARMPPKMGYGKAADWWSLGIMIYEMLSGTPTFRGADLRQTYQKILYADLEFHPEERFSMAARLLLQGMIKRDPTTRLGAWENPPQDIMSAPFFGGIQWDAIYERRFDGPYVPEVQAFGSSARARSSKTAGSAPTGEGEDAGKNSGHSSNNAGSGSGKVKRGTGAGGEGEGDESSGISDDEDSGSELKGMRDSVFIRPHDAGGNNLLDWSFIDEKVLAETCAEGDPSTKKKRKKKRTPKQPAAEAEEGEQKVSISEEIATNKVGFAAPVAASQPAVADAGDAQHVQEQEQVDAAESTAAADLDQEQNI